MLDENIVVVVVDDCSSILHLAFTNALPIPQFEIVKNVI